MRAIVSDPELGQRLRLQAGRRLRTIYDEATCERRLASLEWKKREESADAWERWIEWARANVEVVDGVLSQSDQLLRQDCLFVCVVACAWLEGPTRRHHYLDPLACRALEVSAPRLPANVLYEALASMLTAGRRYDGQLRDIFALPMLLVCSKLVGEYILHSRQVQLRLTDATQVVAIEATRQILQQLDKAT